MNSNEWLFPRVRVRPADTELSQGYCGTGLTVAAAASAVTVGAGAAGAVATTLVMVTTLVTNTVTTLVTVMILVAGGAAGGGAGGGGGQGLEDVGAAAREAEGGDARVGLGRPVRVRARLEERGDGGEVAAEDGVRQGRVAEAVVEVGVRAVLGEEEPDLERARGGHRRGAVVHQGVSGDVLGVEARLGVEEKQHDTHVVCYLDNFWRNAAGLK